MSDTPNPESPNDSLNGWHVNEYFVRQLRLGMRGTQAHTISVPFDSGHLVPDTGRAQAQEEIRQELAQLLRQDPAIATWVMLRNNLAAAEKGVAESQIRRGQADLNRKRLLLEPLTTQRMEQMAEINRAWGDADGAMASFASARNALQKEVKAARQKAELVLDHHLQKLTSAALQRFSEAIPTLAQAVADVAGAALDALAAGLQGVMYTASMQQALRYDFIGILNEIEVDPGTSVAPLDAPPAAAPPAAAPGERHVRIPAAMAAGYAGPPPQRDDGGMFETVQIEFFNEEPAAPVQPEPEAGPAQPVPETSQAEYAGDDEDEEQDAVKISVEYRDDDVVPMPSLTHAPAADVPPPAEPTEPVPVPAEESPRPRRRGSRSE